ncbi:helix-turn-helix transcriptional regulator [Fredinandcohnia humi]
MLRLMAPPLPTLLDAGEDTYEIGQTHPNRNQIGVFDLLIVTTGCLLMGESKQKYEVKGEHTLILYPDRHHFSYKPCEERTHFYWFHFTTANVWTELSETSTSHSIEKERSQGRNPFSEYPFRIVLPKFCNVDNWKAVDHLCQQIIRAENEWIYSWEWQKQVLFQQLLQELSSEANVSKSLPSLAVAEQAAAYLRRNYQKKIGYEELGKALRFHPNHIARCMINSLGCTPIEYVTRVRLDQAKLLLISKDWSIEKISESCGFSQMAYFSRIFKKQEGITPREFRYRFSGEK